MTKANPAATTAEEKAQAPTANKGTAREKYMKEISENPRFKEAPKSGQGFGIVGARIIIAALALAALATVSASAQNSTASGNTTTLRDSRGNVVSRSTTTGNTTTNYDPAGRNIGRFTTDR